ncbi:amidohydrolase family protein [Pseudoalteromonas mariniglutinosa]|uniref:amidohydrolase family protein n=1 Tax=Pseudoalteromonas mariniglutinosa TaxID=206042 RepID=UPI00384D00CA
MSEYIIDPHVHFFNLLEGQYHWLQGDSEPQWQNLPQIKAATSLSALQQQCPFQLAGLVHIEAGFDNNAPIKELNWLAKHLAGFNYKAISYAKIDSTDNQFSKAITNLKHTSLMGVRDITEGNDSKRLLNQYCHHNLSLLAAHGLLFEAQFAIENSIVTKQIVSYCQSIPTLNLVINHMGLPSNIAAWQQNIATLARCDNVFIKYSGQELLGNTVEQQRHIFNTLIKCFGEQRVMFASNFPVCQINASYQARWQGYLQLCHNHSQWYTLSNKNAASLYQL